MAWQNLLDKEETKAFPWTGGGKICSVNEVYTLGRTDSFSLKEYGWYDFKLIGRAAFAIKQVEQDIAFGEKFNKWCGYIVGSRIILDGARVDPDPTKLVDQSTFVYLVPPETDWFSRASVIRLWHNDTLICWQQEFPQGPEQEVLQAYQDRKESLDHIKGVPPALDLAFRYLSWQRLQDEEREQERQKRIEEEVRKAEEAVRFQEALKTVGTGVGRRVVAEKDFNTAARVALAITGAELLDARPSARRNEMVVRFRYRGQRFECIVNKTLHIIDSGICLTDHDTGENYEHLLTLQSLPNVIGEAIDTHKLVVWRHV